MGKALPDFVPPPERRPERETKKPRVCFQCVCVCGGGQFKYFVWVVLRISGGGAMLEDLLKWNRIGDGEMGEGTEVALLPQHSRLFGYVDAWYCGGASSRTMRT